MTFRPRPVATALSVLGVAGFVSLGTWQVRRGHEADAERAAYAERLALPAFDVDDPPPDPSGRRAVVTGVPDWDHVLLVTGRVEGGRVGNRAIVPVATARGGHVLVDVGWIPSEGADAVITRERAVPGERTWSGLSRVYAEDPAATGGYAPEGGYQRRWRAVSPAAMGAAVDAAVPGFVVIAGEGIAEGAENPDTEPPIAGWPAAPEQRPHGQYAITWFGCAAALAAVWFRSSVRD